MLLARKRQTFCDPAYLSDSLYFNDNNNNHRKVVSIKRFCISGCFVQKFIKSSPDTGGADIIISPFYRVGN